MQILTTIPWDEWHWSESWLNHLLEKSPHSQIIVYNQMPHIPFQHSRVAFWDMYQQVYLYRERHKEVHERMARALSDGARTRIKHIWHSTVRDMALADFMDRSPYEFVWIQNTAWLEYTLHQDYLQQQLHLDDGVLWNHQGHQRTDIMLLGGSANLRRLTAQKIHQYQTAGSQWISRQPDEGWQWWLQDWSTRMVEGDDSVQFYQNYVR